MKKKTTTIEQATAERRKQYLSRLSNDELNIVKLIEFMGYRLAICNNGLAWVSPYRYAVDDHFKIHGMLLEESLRMNKLNINSLDVLKPVIDKIGSKDFGTLKFEPFANVSLYSSAKQIYEEIIEFIDWYNENKNQ